MRKPDLKKYANSRGCNCNHHPVAGFIMFECKGDCDECVTGHWRAGVDTSKVYDNLWEINLE